MQHPGFDLRWLMILRVVTITTLLVSAFAIELVLRPEMTLQPLFTLAATAYGMVLAYAGLHRWLKRWPAFLHVQLAGDALLITGFVAITGGVESPMSFLYVLPILVAAVVLLRKGALITAGVCWTLYLTLLVLPIPVRLSLEPAAVEGASDPARMGYLGLVHGVAFLAVAMLGSFLSERLKTTKDELAERRGAVARLQALNENIIESINSGLLTTDEDGRIRFLNRGGCEITGYRPEEVLNRNVREFLDLPEPFLRTLRPTLRQHRRCRFERYFRRADGETIFLGVAASTLYDRSGQPLGFIFIFQDLTEIQALEAQVRLKERMAALGEMAAGMAHELRNPLASMSGAVQYLKDHLPAEGEVLELMDIILRESHRLDQAIRDFLTFARPGPFRPERTDLVRLFEENLKLLEKSPEFKPCHRVVTDFAERPLWCGVDPNRVKQIFWNLATNALKAMPGGGRLTVHAELRNGGRELVVSFGDEGRGMDADEVASYFQPFRGSFGTGTGLGTAIVYRLVEEHGGRIELKSRPGRGTWVRIYMPRWAEPGAAAQEGDTVVLRAAQGA